LKVRLAKDSDIDGLLMLWNNSMKYDILSPEILEEKIWDDPDFDPSLCFVVEHRTRIIALMMAVCRPENKPKLSYIKMCAVLPEFQKKGIGGRLLEEIEKRLVARGIESIRICESAPNYLNPGLDARYTGAMVFFERHGYKRFNETWNLEVDLSKKNEKAKKAGAQKKVKDIKLGRAQKSDLKLVADLLEKEKMGSWLPEVKNGFANSPVSIFVARKDDKVMAFAGYDCNNKNTGWFGPMLTDSTMRRAGIGGLLLHKCLDEFKKQGKHLATIPWVGPIGFYVKNANAAIARVFYRYEKKINLPVGQL